MCQKCSLEQCWLLQMQQSFGELFSNSVCGGKDLDVECQAARNAVLKSHSIIHRVWIAILSAVVDYLLWCWIDIEENLGKWLDSGDFWAFHCG